MEISKCIKDARQKNNISQESLAEQLGVSRQTISSWENGKSYPDIVSIIKISDIFDISLDELLKDYKVLTKTNCSKVKTISIGKVTKENIKNTKYNIEQIVEKINNILALMDEEMQTFITTTEIHLVDKNLLANSKIFHVSEGIVEEE